MESEIAKLLNCNAQDKEGLIWEWLLAGRKTVLLKGAPAAPASQWLLRPAGGGNDLDGLHQTEWWNCCGTQRWATEGQEILVRIISDYFNYNVAVV